ncbi:sodium:sulfate symporter [Pseudodesulfovibrio sp. F-1]|uniref:Sodium:sulfate symporter n=1 Tax=Pseudodesulfovibrio alkaliphilus TaxID=2661613 RepID=A0A7K1KM53_9BACT|nr:sodium:sulfate symporter [Pseudodesulfovibrio alkaliphilus]
MDASGDFAAYAWSRVPLVLLFAGGYLVYQLMAATRLTDAFVTWALRRSGGRAPAILLYVIGVAAILSSFIPNAVTVLALLPVLKRLDEGFARQGAGGMSTVLMCSAIYGAAIGGTGSMIGSPANAVLFGALDIFNVPGRQGITFFSWFLWSVPLVVMLVAAAWGVVAVLGLPTGARRVVVRLACVGEECAATDRQRYGGILFWLYMGFWVLESVAREVWPWFAEAAPWVCLAFTVLFVYLLFVRPAPGSEAGQGPLLRPRDLLTAVPRRGLLFILILTALFAAVRWLGWDRWLVVAAGRLAVGDMPGELIFLLMVLAVIFLTEVLSNTAVVAAFFAIAHFAASAHGLDPLPLMLGVSVASTCAFMTPIASPTNALAFGEMRGASLWGMLGLGLVLNLVAAVILAGWLGWVLPLIY